MPEGIHYGRSLTSNQTSALLHACARHVYVSSAISFPICVRVWKGMSRATILTAERASVPRYPRTIIGASIKAEKY